MDVILPQFTRVVRPVIQQILDDFIVDLTANNQVAVKQYTANAGAGDLTTIADITECDYSGYAPQIIAAWQPSAVDRNGQAYVNPGLNEFRHNGGAVTNTVVGDYLVQDNGGTTATGTVVTGGGGALTTPVVTAGGGIYAVPPRLTFAGAPGVGATGHAVLTNGVVTSFVIDTPGSGYVAATVAFEPPYELVCFRPYVDPGRIMALATDSCPIVMQQAIPAISFEGD